MSIWNNFYYKFFSTNLLYTQKLLRKLKYVKGKIKNNILTVRNKKESISFERNCGGMRAIEHLWQLGCDTDGAKVEMMCRK